MCLVLLAPASLLRGQVSDLEVLTRQILEMEARWRRAPGGEKEAIAGDVDAALARRKRILASWIVREPARAASLALPTSVLAALRQAFPKSAQHLEQRNDWEGVLEELVEDDFEHGMSRTIVRLKTAGETLEVHWAGPRPAGVQAGAVVRLRGVRVGNRVAATSATIVALASQAAACAPAGQQNIAAILVETPSYKLPAGVDADQVRGILFGNQFTARDASPDRFVDDFWRENSDGQTTAPGASAAVVGPFLLTKDYDKDAGGQPYCDADGILQEALNRADPQLYLPQYSRILIVVPDLSPCQWSGLGHLGCWAWHPHDGGFTASVVWQKGRFMQDRSNGVILSTHELGHNLGLHHASSREFTLSGVRVPLGPLGDPGTLNEYGDRFSTMGSWNLGLYNAPHAAEILGWLQQGLHYLVVQSSGTYTIEPYERRPFGLKALKIRRGTGNDAWLWIEYRQNLGIYDSTLHSHVFSGALIHYADSTTGSRSHLLDFTPNDDWTQVALAAGQSWQDPYSDLSLTVLAASSAGLTVSVNYLCSQANPTVTLNPSTTTVLPGGTVTFTVSVKNNDSPGCGAGVFALSSSLPSGWASQISPSSLSLSPGATGTATLSKTAPSSAAPGTYAVNATAVKGAYSGSASGTITVQPPPAPDLVVTNLVAASNGVSGAQLSISVTVHNQGTANAAAFQIGFYYSPDEAVSTADVNSGWVCNYPSGLAAGASSTCAGPIGVPASLQPGAYYLGAIVDDTNVVAESNEANNTRAADNGLTTVVSPRGPTAVSVAPAGGTGAVQAFQFFFSDPDGWSDLTVVNILINFWLDGRQACYLAYLPASRSLLLVDDAGNAGGPFQGMVLPGSQTIANSQCTIYGSGSSAAGSGQTLTLTLNVAFSAGFAGTRIIYLAARDAAGNNSGWQRLGVWSVPGAAPGSLAVAGVSPQYGSGAGPVTFTVTFSDTAGWLDLDVVNVLVNDWLDGRFACYLAYSRPLNIFYLVTDGGAALLPGLLPGSSGTASNSQCTVYASGSAASGSGNILTLALRVSFSGTFAGNRVIYAAARDLAGRSSGWQAVGTWAAP